MIWESWSDFFAMGGYALYVWGSLVVVFGCMVCEVIAVALRRKTIMMQLTDARIASAAKRAGVGQ
jgi:heme exporter protein D